MPTGAGQLTVSWHADGHGLPITRYRVDEVTTGQSRVLDGGQTAATFDGLPIGATAQFRVVATNDLGDGPGGTATATVVDAPPVESHCPLGGNSLRPDSKFRAPSPSCFILLTHWMRRAASRAAWTAGKSRAINTAMIAMTTNSSISVKPVRLRGFPVITQPSSMEEWEGQPAP